ncbi:hypothetical protein CHRYSEO8AT_260085 [Chryseobacterium sp. 8AT]|nr:hypothetical protein CHRYSEO8AT_260085 [Chryseobacterium sp. 8AT]
MTQNSYPYENAITERINGILKQEFNIINTTWKQNLKERL